MKRKPNYPEASLNIINVSTTAINRFVVYSYYRLAYFHYIIIKKISKHQNKNCVGIKRFR